MKRGINLGCGRVILPCDQPEHHGLIPAELYTDPAITWDNVDWNAEPGVNKVVDLFDYPWHGLEDNTYDVAICSHIAEHIPHHIVWEGQFVHRHPEYQDGWFAFFAQLWRVMKPGGKAYILSPYAFSNGGVSDPTHTRYLTAASFNYFNAPTNGSPFTYRMGQTWQVNLERFLFTPHLESLALAQASYHVVESVTNWFMVVGQDKVEPPPMDWSRMTNRLSFIYVNMIADFCVEMTAVKDESHSEGVAAAASEVGDPSQRVDAERVAESDPVVVAGSGAAG